MIGAYTYQNDPDFKNKIARFIWGVIWLIFARPIPRMMLNSWKIALLRAFGAKIHSKAIVYSSARIYMPWKLEMAAFAVLAAEVDCYNVAKITIGAYSIISQKTYLCAASHDITKINMPLIAAPIDIKDQVWISADAYIGMGVTIGQGAIVGARASVFKDVKPWTIVGGNPAKFIKNRTISES